MSHDVQAHLISLGLSRHKPDSALDTYRALTGQATRTDGVTSLNGHTGGYAGGHWENRATGYGTTRDKTTYTEFRGYQPIDLITLSNLYHGYDMAQRVVDVVPGEEFRLPFVVYTTDDKVDETVAQELEKLNARERMLEARIWGQLYGGCALVYGGDDGLGAGDPINLKGMKSLDWLQVVDRRYLWPVSYYQLGPKAGTPDRYVLSQTWVGVAQGAFVIHESRMLRFPGARTSQREKNLNASWDYSILDRVYPTLRMFEGIWKGIEILITDGPQAVYKVKGLFDKILAGQEAAMQQRFAMIDTWRSVLRAILIDADQEDFSRQTVTFSGLDNILNQATMRLAASLDIPAARLGGPRVAGLNASDDNDLRSFYDRVAASQESILGPRIKELVRVILSMLGRDDLKDKVSVKFPPLYTPSALEQAQERAAQATADNTYIQAGVFTPEEIALSRVLDKGVWSTEWSAVDRTVREKLLKKALSELEASTTVPEVGEQVGPDGEQLDPGVKSEDKDKSGSAKVPEQGAKVESDKPAPSSSGAPPTSMTITAKRDVILGTSSAGSGPDARPVKKTKDLKE